MPDLRSDVARYIRREELLLPGEPLWVGVSGGVDSMVLLHLLRTLGHDCTVAHVDHGLRGAESDADREFVQAYCAREGIECRTTRVDVRAHAEGSGHSTQSAARELRYARFGSLIAERPMPFALAHHADDAVETLLIALLRGTGAYGWGTIPPRNGPYRRPLLRAGRGAILAYATEQGLTYREDSGNTDPKYLRNRIRHEVIPLLEDLRPGALRTLSRSVDMLREVEELAHTAADRATHGIEPLPDGTLVVPFDLLKSHSSPGLLLHALLRHRGFHPDVIDRVREAVADKATGGTFSSASWEVRIEQGRVVIAPVGAVR